MGDAASLFSGFQWAGGPGRVVRAGVDGSGVIGVLQLARSHKVRAPETAHWRDVMTAAKQGLNLSVPTK